MQALNFIIIIIISSLLGYNINTYNNNKIVEGGPNFTASFGVGELESISTLKNTDLITIKLKNYKNYYKGFYKEEVDRVSEENKQISNSKSVFLMANSREINNLLKEKTRNLKIGDKIIFENKRGILDKLDFKSNLELNNFKLNEGETYIGTQFLLGYSCDGEKIVLDNLHSNNELGNFINSFLVSEQYRFKKVFNKIVSDNNVCN
ncbi:hypothetical protein D8B46_08510 [Candidatus Gracilibacteria bacterium]|nr:MAG: hypothetical protein D8B46_08510 [Candidatus Gracilibacteria bacterium]